ncbi:outer membrane lipoprotein carrier protein LolA [Stenoxybacter acetivorans]|uniref:outer membrane lipoprotein carrier protein LolA n=1 Tax=Stenoxybacter acetivorans TaxID=422441 RepID=UPI0005666698|nr:outer membrane lipoprotein carrier protein LolA [Stenoxybacter acetivorans]
MKKYLFYLCIWLLPLLAHAFDLNDLSRQLQQPQSIQGEFIQQRYLASLNKPLQTEGVFVLQPKKILLWDMQKPFAQRLRVRADGIDQWNGQNWQRSANQSAAQRRQMQLFLDLLGGNAQGLQQHFSMALSGNAQRWQLLLQPKSALMQQIFTRINIRGNAVVREVEIAEKQGDKTVMRFENIRIDAPFSQEQSRALAQ